MNVDPRVYACGWEAVVLWPWLSGLGDGFNDSWLEPSVLSRVLGIPEQICSTGLENIQPLLTVTDGRCVLACTPSPRYLEELCSVKVGAGADVGDPGVHDAPAGMRPPARRPAHVSTREGEALRTYLEQTWDRQKLGKLDPWIEHVVGTYPELDLVYQAKSARAWELVSAKRAKVNVRRFLDNWFRRAKSDVRKQHIDSGTGHWSKLSRNERRVNSNEGRDLWECRHPSGVVLQRSLSDDLFVLCISDLMDERLPFREEITRLQIKRLKRHEDVHDPDKVTALLESLGARAEGPRALTSAIDELATDAREREGLLPA